MSAEALPKFKPYTRQTIRQAPQWQLLTPEQQEAVQVISHVLPFRTNQYVLEQLIDWDNIPDDPDLPAGVPASRHAARARVLAAARPGAGEAG